MTRRLMTTAATLTPYRGCQGVTSRQFPWMGAFSTKVDDITSVDQALNLGGLTWEVGKRNIRTMGGTLIPDFQAVVRTDTKAVLGVVGRNFQPLQNANALAPVDALLGESGGVIEAVGALNEGRRVFVAIRLPVAVQVPGDPTLVTPYMIVANGHDGSLALSVNVLEGVLRCTNILVALSKRAAYRIRLVHCPGIEARYQAAHQVIGMTTRYLAESNDLKADLAATRITEGGSRRIIQAAFPVRRVQDTSAQDGGTTGRPTQFDGAWRNLWESPTIPDRLRGTAWGAVQAVTEWVDHSTAFRGGPRGGAEERRANALLFGGRADTQKARAVEAALGLQVRRRTPATV